MLQKIKSYIQFVGKSNHLILGFMLVLSTTYAFWQNTKVETQTSNQKEVFRVIEAKKTDFGTEYTLNFDNKNWKYLSYDLLDIGYEYTGELETQLPNFDSYFQPDFNQNKNNPDFDLYNFSQGYSGKVKNLQIETKNLDCNLYCLGIRWQNRFRIYTQNRYFELICNQQDQWIAKIITDNNCQDSYGFSMGLIFGGSNFLPQKSRQLVRDLGISHILALSGFQVAVFAGFMEKFANSMNIGSKKTILWVILALSFLIFIAGFQPSVLRSTLSFILSLISLKFLGRKLNPLRGLIYSCIILLILFPHFQLSVSFQLSVLATLGIALNPFEKLNSWLGALVNMFLATLMVLPVIGSFGEQNPINLVANYIITLLSESVYMLNLGGLVPVIGDFLVLIANIIQSFMFAFIKDFGLFSSLYKPDYSYNFDTPSTLIYTTLLAFLLGYYKFLLQNSIPQKVDQNPKANQLKKVNDFGN
jgi:ComEC/Rec2-related protein